MDYNIECQEFSARVEQHQRQLRNEVIAQYVKERRKKKLTQEQVATVAGIKRTNITRFESGMYNPTLDMMVRIAESMGMELDIRLVDQSGKSSLQGGWDER